MYTFLVDLLQPYTLVFLLAGVALAALWRRRHETRRRLVLLTVAYVILLLLSTPAVSHLAIGSLEWGYPPPGERPADADAIVVLSAGVYPAGETGSRAELDEDSLRRCLHAAELYRQGKPCPVIVSGGVPDSRPSGPPFAHVMRDFLREVGVRDSDLVVEDRSRTTYENAVETCKLLRERGLTKVVLVTDAVDMLRAEGCFRKQGVAPIPSPCHYRANRFRLSVFTFLPSPGAVRGFHRAWHEWLGIAWYWMHDRI